MRNYFIILFIASISNTLLAQDTIQKDFSAGFNKYEVKGCFLLYSQADSQLIQYNAAYCDSGYLPASTFKIPHSLIVLKEELIHDTNQVIPWDGKERAYDVWNKDQNLASALRNSCVWAYASFTKDIAHDRYQYYVDNFEYGNKNIIGRPNMFWLAGLLRISANQQIDFLRKFYNYELEIDKKHIDLVKELIVLKKTDHYILSGKTGAGMMAKDDYIMWLVGYLEKEDNTYFYALNYKSNDFDKDKAASKKIAMDIFKELKLID